MTYQALDKLIVERIRNTPNACLSRQLTCYQPIRAEADRIARATGRDVLRVLDGRLQALKRQSQIRFTGNGWRIVEASEDA